tara:strand:- start:347 stop:715 length:369 start_codon:yes stop_codon:yes gene_type:complete
MKDFFGILLSGLCLIHCWGLPFFLPLISKLEHGFDKDLIHLILLLVVSSYTAIFLWPHTERLIKLISGGGLIILYLAMLFQGEVGETLLTITGSATLMCAHILNLRALTKKNHDLNQMTKED